MELIMLEAGNNFQQSDKFANRSSLYRNLKRIDLQTIWAGRKFFYRCCCHVTDDVFISGQGKSIVKFQQSIERKFYTEHFSLENLT